MYDGHIFIVHYKPCVDRKQYLTEYFNAHGFTKYTFVDDYQREDLTVELRDAYFSPTVRLPPAVYCITISHIEIYKRILSLGMDRCLILEDDARPCDDFFTVLDTYLADLPNDVELAFLNDGCGLHATTNRVTNYWHLHNKSRTCCSYIITKQCIMKLLSTMVPCNQAIDHELNTQIALHNLRVYWCEPTIVSDGSGRVYQDSYNPRQCV